jgi:hypothetical protein
MADLETTLLDGGKGALSGLATGGPVGALIGAVTGVLPGIADALFGKNAPGVAAAVTAAVSSVSGVANPTAADVAGLTPDQQSQLRVQLAQIAAADKASQRATELAQLTATLSDVAGARAQTIDLARAGSKLAWGAAVVSVIVLVSFGVMAWLVMYSPIPPGSADLAARIEHTFELLCVGVVSYWVGSSAGSAAKNDMLFQSTPIPPGAPGATAASN